MTALYVIAAIALFLFLLLVLPADIILSYREEVALTLRVLFFRFPLVPQKEKKIVPSRFTAAYYRRLTAKDEAAEKEAAEKAAQKAEKKAAAKAEKKTQKEADKAAGRSSASSFSELSERIGGIKALAVKVIARFAKRLSIRVRRCFVSVGTGDAASTALATGTINAALLALAEVLRNASGLDDESAGKLTATPDFLSEGFRADVEILFRLRVFGVLDILITGLHAFLKDKDRILPSKGGQDSPAKSLLKQEKEQQNG